MSTWSLITKHKAMFSLMIFELLPMSCSLQLIVPSLQMRLNQLQESEPVTTTLNFFGLFLLKTIVETKHTRLAKFWLTLGPLR